MRDPPERPGGGGFVQNFWGERYVWRPTPWGPMRDDGPGALAGATTFAQLESFDWPSPDLFDYSGLSGPVPPAGLLRPALRLCRRVAAARPGRAAGKTCSST